MKKQINYHPLRVLVAGCPYSIHATRFVSLLQEIGYSVQLFECSGSVGNVEEHLHDTVVHVAFPIINPENGNRLYGYRRISTMIMTLVRKNVLLQKVISFLYFKILSKYLASRSQHLAKILQTWKPDLIFSLRMQDEGYTVLQAKGLLGKRFTVPWVHFSWGTDYEFFGKHPEYQREHLP
jgi:hypothetical protein